MWKLKTSTNHRHVKLKPTPQQHQHTNECIRDESCSAVTWLGGGSRDSASSRSSAASHALTFPDCSHSTAQSIWRKCQMLYTFFFQYDCRSTSSTASKVSNVKAPINKMKFNLQSRESSEPLLMQKSKNKYRRFKNTQTTTELRSDTSSIYSCITSQITIQHSRRDEEAWKEIKHQNTCEYSTHTAHT